jgi:hypothetical protein
LFILLSVLIVNDSTTRISNKEGLPLLNQTVSWALLGKIKVMILIF